MPYNNQAEIDDVLEPNNSDIDSQLLERC